MQGKKIRNNILISISVQLVSLLVSFILSFLVPKFINEYQYSYWQMYVLYASYVGILHFGLLDGIVLRYSQYDYEDLDKARIRSQFQILLISTAAFSFILLGLSGVLFGGVSSRIAILVAVSIITKNVVTYNTYSFQITNRIDRYAMLILAQRVSYGAVAVALLALRVNQFEWYCIADLFGDCVGIVFAQFFNKGMYFGKSITIVEALKEWKINVSSGIFLMLANWSSLIMAGSAKMIVQWHWDELTFGKMSFAFSVSNLFLTFVTAISVVLFPSLKRMEQDELPKLYKNIRCILVPVLFVGIVAYYPGCVLLKWFLPKYSESLRFLGILLPMVIYTSKVSLLTNNYLKAYRKENYMLYANLISAAAAIVMFVISAYILNILEAVLISLVLATMINSILSEIYVCKIICIDLRRDFIIEAMMTAGFIFCTQNLRFGVGCICYVGFVAIYLIMERKRIIQTIKGE